MKNDRRVRNVGSYRVGVALEESRAQVRESSGRFRMGAQVIVRIEVTSCGIVQAPSIVAVVIMTGLRLLFESVQDFECALEEEHDDDGEEPGCRDPGVGKSTHVI